MMATPSRGTVQRATQTAVIVLTTAIVQWAIYAVELRQDVQDLKRDVSALNCKVAIVSQEIALPPGCVARRAQP